MAKSLCLTYLLWLVGGWLGLHHVYLRRYRQALVWWCLPGGYFGLGWFRELWRIPEYVRDANDDPAHLRAVKEKVKDFPRPPLNVFRLLGEMLLANMLAAAVTMGIPERGELAYDFSWLGVYLAPAAIACGVWLVGNIGREEGSLVPPLVASYLCLPLYFLGIANTNYATFASIIAFNAWSRQWRKRKREIPVCNALLLLTVCGGLYSSLWVSYAYFNLKMRTANGDEIHFRDSVGNFWRSPAVVQFRENMHHVWEHGKEHGFYSAFDQLVESLDPLGERAALESLELDWGASQEEIKSKYRELTKMWHPDKVTDPQEKEVAHERFMEIQSAYETLSSIKMKRSRKQRLRPGGGS